MSNEKIAVITGVSGQDGSYLAELLLEKGYNVYGFVRSARVDGGALSLPNLRHLLDTPRLHILGVDVTDEKMMREALCKIRPDEIYHLAAQSHTPRSFESAWNTFDTNTHSTLTILTVIKEVMPNTKFYFAASSELFGDAVESPQNENTRFNPSSPYGISKVAGFYLTRLYREKYSLFACSGICFSHESPRRENIFVTRKITSAAARIKYGLADKLILGNIETRRDWGYAGDFVEAIWRMLQQPQSDDYVIGTQENHTIKEFVERAFAHVGLDWKKYVTVDPQLHRPAEINPWLADASKARRVLAWKPTIGFGDLVAMMMEKDIECAKLEVSRKIA